MFIMKPFRKTCWLSSTSGLFHPFSVSKCNSSSKTHYETLGVPKEASFLEIKKAFYKLTREVHPDRDILNRQLHHRFTEINEAYSILSKAKSRNKYNAQLGVPLSAPFSDENLTKSYSTSETSSDTWIFLYLNAMAAVFIFTFWIVEYIFSMGFHRRFDVQKQLIRRMCHYEVLGVTQQATTKEIKSAYLTEAKKYHPDTDSSNKSLHTRFIEINRAYDILSKPISRKVYDDSLRPSINLGMPNRMRNYPYADPPKSREYSEWKQYEPFPETKDLIISSFAWLLIFCHVVVPLFFMISLLMTPRLKRKGIVRQIRRDFGTSTIRDMVD